MIYVAILCDPGRRIPNQHAGWTDALFKTLGDVDALIAGLSREVRAMAWPSMQIQIGNTLACLEAFFTPCPIFSRLLRQTKPSLRRSHRAIVRPVNRYSSRK